MWYASTVYMHMGIGQAIQQSIMNLLKMLRMVEKLQKLMVCVLTTVYYPMFRLLPQPLRLSEARREERGGEP